MPPNGLNVRPYTLLGTIVNMNKVVIIFLRIMYLMLINDKKTSLGDIKNFLTRGYLGQVAT